MRRFSDLHPLRRQGLVNLNALSRGNVQGWESVRPPREERARRARGQGEGCGGIGADGDWQIVLRRCAGAARERSIGRQPGRMGTGRSYRAAVRKGAATSETSGARLARQGRETVDGAPGRGIPRALGSSGRCTRQGASGAGRGPGDRTERRREGQQRHRRRPEARLARRGWETVDGPSGQRHSAEKARNPAGFGFVWFFRVRARAHPGRSFGPYRVQEFYPICGPDATPISTLPARRHAMRHLPVTLSDFRDTCAAQRSVNLNPIRTCAVRKWESMRPQPKSAPAGRAGRSWGKLGSERPRR